MQSPPADANTNFDSVFVEARFKDASAQPPTDPTAGLKSTEAANGDTPEVLEPLFEKVSEMLAKGQTLPEGHPPIDSGVVKPLVFGGLDGIITTFAVIAGSVGARLSFLGIITMGLANLLADAFSMGLGELASSHAEHEYELGKQKLKYSQLKETMEEQELTLVGLYMDKGLNAEDACAVVSLMGKYPEVLCNSLLIEEQGIMPPEPDSDAAKQGGVMFTAFILFGAVPLVFFAVMMGIMDRASEADESKTDLNILYSFYASCFATALTLFILGAVKAKFTEQPVFKSACKMLGIGVISGLVAFGVGEGLTSVMAD